MRGFISKAESCSATLSFKRRGLIASILLYAVLLGSLITTNIYDWAYLSLLGDLQELQEQLDKREAQLAEQAHANHTILVRLATDLIVQSAKADAIMTEMGIEDLIDEFSDLSLEMPERITDEALIEISNAAAALKTKLSVLQNMRIHSHISDRFMPKINQRVSSGFGYRTHPVTGESARHQGIDIPRPMGSNIRPAAPGMVVFSGWRNGYGNVIEIDHLNGYYTLYAHNSENLVEVGEMVTRQTIIGKVGMTGTATSPHIHLEVHYSGRQINPMAFVSHEHK